MIYIHTFKNKKQAEFCFSNKLKKTPYSYRKHSAYFRNFLCMSFNYSF